MLLLVGAGLFVRTFSSLAHLALGFDREPLLVASVNIQPLQLESDARGQLMSRLREAALATPNVASAALSVVTPISGSTWSYRLELLDGKPIEIADKSVYVNVISPDWFKTYGTRMLAGRDFTAVDTRGAGSVAIVNEAFARKFTGGANPMGRRVREPARPSSPNPEREIIAYVADAAYRSLREPVPPTMYLPLEQNPTIPSSISISVRSATGSPALLTRGLASALTGVNSGVAITFRPLADQIDASLTQERLVAMLSGFFGVLALLLAALGLYGVTSYAVSRRRSEIGLRMALGAAPAGVVWMVLGRVGLLVGLGILAGLSTSLWASKFVTPLLYGLQPRDPVTMIASALVLGAIGTLAGWIPAMRASRIDPARVLRDG
jgi:predicted permease